MCYNNTYLILTLNLTMNRYLLASLLDWRQKTNRKPLLLMGARQVGKTTLLHTFGKSFENYVYLNFEDQPRLKDLFTNSLDPHDIIPAIAIEKKIKITPEKTLIIFDEVQECPDALNSLKYFNENAKEYPVCAAGSLLGVKLKNTKGFPVGQVHFLHLYPLSFGEFLEAINEAQLKKYLDDVNALEPLSAIIHQRCMDYFKLYLYIGGMPEAVHHYAQHKDLRAIRDIQNNILNAYHLDFAKHAPPDQIMRINQVWKSIPAQLAKENQKFVYSVIRKGARAREFEMAIQWLFEAGLIYKIYQISVPKIPIKAYSHFDFFKLFLLDVGLLGAMTDLSADTLLHGDQLFQEFKGTYGENYVAQVFARYYPELYYWSSEGKAELDFIIQHENHIYPVEVKSGETNKKRSLLVYQSKYDPILSIRVSPLNLKKDGSILNIPFYFLDYIKKLLGS